MNYIWKQGAYILGFLLPNFIIWVNNQCGEGAWGIEHMVVTKTVKTLGSLDDALDIEIAELALWNTFMKISNRMGLQWC